jgi:cell migration-inducing and hyaluronan-binding protein
MGQGGRIMHYPVHFHEARKTPADTYVDDSSVHDSMTRWYVIHSTQDVTLARNVGYLSIGHGYYLEDATETDNKFYSDIGIFARAAVDNAQNPRKVPGILADNGGSPAEPLRGTSDYNYPAVFWITNGWNEFEGNMAVGAGACGACYWLVPAFNSDARDVPNSGEHMSWSGYSALQQNIQFEGTTPLKAFYKNICTGAMNSFTTVSGVAPCFGVNSPDTSTPGFINAVKSIAPPPTTPDKIADDTYYSHFDTGGNRKATICPADPKDPAAHDCSTITVPCSNGSGAGNCGLTLLDHYTTSFNWADYNFSAIWLRPQWYLVDNSVISDVQNSGLTFVTGGDYTNASVIQGFWALASHSVFIGTTQPTNPFASDIGPFSSTSGLSCVYAVNHCRNVDEGVSIQLASFAVEQRLFSIYDGPNYQDSNAYLDILKEPCTSFVTCMYFNVPGVRKDPTNMTDPVPGYLPNAAIGWKQPNGFYYPPAFHSDNMFFNNVDIRHYVNIPLFEALSTNLATQEAGTYITDQTGEMQQYINPGFTFSGMTDIDRQTVLNDDDGSLGGLGSTAALPEAIMVNNDTFYSAPTETAECMSNVGVNPTTTSSTCPPVPTTPPTAGTSPYEYITTAISPACANSDGCGSYTGPVVCEDARCRQIPGRGGQWSSDCAGPYCFGVRLFRQHLTGSNAGGGTREWQSWISNGCDDIANAAQARCQFPFIRMGTQNSWQRSAMTVNHGTFYIDTSISQHTQTLSQFNDPSSGYFDCSIRAAGACQPLSVNTFVGGQTYYVYFIYAKGTTRQVYQMYVGEGFDPDNMVQAIRMDIDTIPFKPKGGTFPWATTGWKREMITGADGKTDVLQVTVDFSTFAGELNPVNTDASGALTNPTCMPADFCAWNKTIKSCGCNLAPNDPRWVADPNLAASCSHACNVWAVKDLDCPPAGCLGFSVTMQPGFQAVDQYKRPKPQMFPTSNPLTDFTAMFKRTTVTPDSASGGTCYYGSLPNSCPNPN